MAKAALRPLAIFVLSVLVLVIIVFALNFWLWVYVAPESYLSQISLTQNDALFLEGMVLIILGVLFLLGRGGIDLWSVKAAVLGSAADALYGRKGRRAPGPAEIMRRDAWKPSGFLRFALVLIFAGIILILLYFVSL